HGPAGADDLRRGTGLAQRHHQVPAPVHGGVVAGVQAPRRPARPPAPPPPRPRPPPHTARAPGAPPPRHHTPPPPRPPPPPSGRPASVAVGARAVTRASASGCAAISAAISSPFTRSPRFRRRRPGPGRGREPATGPSRPPGSR